MTASPRALTSRSRCRAGGGGLSCSCCCFALAVVLFAYGAAGLGLKGKLPAGLPTYILVFAVLMLAAHLAVRRFAPYADPLLLPLAALLNGLGIVMIYRLQESGRNGNPGHQVRGLILVRPPTHQLLYTRHRHRRRWSWSSC